MPDSGPVFVDTSGWIALLNADDQLHGLAGECLHELALAARPLATTDWVLAETGNGLARLPVRGRYVLAVQTFLRSGSSRLLRVDAAIFQRALELYGAMTDKTWGMVDCASFVVMRDAGMRDALSADRHFEQAGFHCLLPAA
jgi:uncharacterized protein